MCGRKVGTTEVVRAGRTGRADDGMGLKSPR